MIGNYLALAAAAGLAAAAPEPANKGKQSGKQRDPNEIVCEKTEIIGSRLNSKRVCKTRAEWVEQRRLDRMEINKAQVGKGSCEGC